MIRISSEWCEPDTAEEKSAGADFPGEGNEEDNDDPLSSLEFLP